MADPDTRDNDSRDNVVSLDHLREQRHRGSPPGEGKTRETRTRAGQGMEPPSAASAPREAVRESAAPLEPRPGRLFWLHCPACGTLEYTELALPGGRRHKCGTTVEEAEVPIDLRAETTLAGINLQRIAALGDYLEQQRRRYEEFQQRLALIAGAPPVPYPLDENVVKALPVAEVDPLGLLVSDALHNPAKRFEKKKE